MNISDNLGYKKRCGAQHCLLGQEAQLDVQVCKLQATNRGCASHIMMAVGKSCILIKVWTQKYILKYEMSVAQGCNDKLSLQLYLMLICCIQETMQMIKLIWIHFSSWLKWMYGQKFLKVLRVYLRFSKTKNKIAQGTISKMCFIFQLMTN